MHELPRVALILLGIALGTQFSYAKNQGATAPGGGNCGQVKCDCSTHKMQIGGKEHTINCGRNNTTRNGTGQVGGRHSGQIVKDGVDIKSPGMGQEGGGKVFHLPFGGGEPTGTDSTKGCIAVNKEVLEQLKGCEGAPLEITGVGGASGGDNGSGAAVRGPASTSRGRSRGAR